MILSLDTNILLRYIWKDVPGQREKTIALLDDETQTFHISDMIISEIIFNLKASHLHRKTIVNIILSILNKKNIKSNPFMKNTVLPYFASHPALSFVDCYAAFEAEKEQAGPLMTFDKKLARQHPNAKLIK